jgi:hypothetical protein
MEILTHIVTFLLGLGAGWSLKMYVNSRSTSTRQSGNVVGGDMAGGDINKKK